MSYMKALRQLVRAVAVLLLNDSGRSAPYLLLRLLLYSIDLLGVIVHRL